MPMRGAAPGDKAGRREEGIVTRGKGGDGGKAVREERRQGGVEWEGDKAGRKEEGRTKGIGWRWGRV